MLQIQQHLSYLEINIKNFQSAVSYQSVTRSGVEKMKISSLPYHDILQRSIETWIYPDWLEECSMKALLFL